MQILLAIAHFVLIVALTFLNGYWLIILDELVLDHLNPADVTKKLNRLVCTYLLNPIFISSLRLKYRV